MRNGAGRWLHAGLGAAVVAVALAAAAACSDQATAPRLGPPSARSSTLAVSSGTDAQALPGTDADGRTVYLGLMFGDNGVGQQFPELFEGQTAKALAVSAEDSASVDSVEAKVVSQIASQNPAFFAGFSGDIRSGDPTRVAAALDHAATESDHAFQAFQAQSAAAWAAAGNPAPDVPAGSDWSDTTMVIRGDSVLVNNGAQLIPMGRYVFFYLYTALALKRVVYHYTFIYQNKAINRYTYINRSRVINRVRYYGHRVDELASDPGEQELQFEQVVNSITTRLGSPSPNPNPSPTPTTTTSQPTSYNYTHTTAF
jgi:hypothetical protein